MSVVIVTGASRGIGAAVAAGLAARGHTVHAAMRRPDAHHELEGADPALDLRPVEMDVTDRGSVERAVARVLEESGRIDGVINNAGIGYYVPFELMSAEVLRSTMETNFFGALSVTQSVLPAMREQRSGRIVMITSLAALTGLPHETAYCASKRALEAAAESLACEVDRFGIGVSVVEPGYTEAGLATSVWDPAMPEVTEYQPLVDHFRAHWDADSVDLEPRSLVVDAVAHALESDRPEFRYALGELGPVVREGIRTRSEADWGAFLREFLGISWWSAGKPSPAEKTGVPS